MPIASADIGRYFKVTCSGVTAMGTRLKEKLEHDGTLTDTDVGRSRRDCLLSMAALPPFYLKRQKRMAKKNHSGSGRRVAQGSFPPALSQNRT